MEEPSIGSVAPLIAAAIAATLLAVVELILFRRVTRCVGLREPRDTECEWCLELELRAGVLKKGVEDMEDRW